MYLKDKDFKSVGGYRTLFNLAKVLGFNGFGAYMGYNTKLFHLDVAPKGRNKNWRWWVHKRLSDGTLKTRDISKEEAFRYGL